MAINNYKSMIYADSTPDISGIRLSDFLPKVTTFLPLTQLHLLRKGVVMFVLAALVCGQRSESLSVPILDASQKPAQSNSYDLGSSQTKLQFELFQNLQIDPVKSDGCDFSDGLHALSSVDDLEQARLLPNYSCHTNDIQTEPLISPTVNSLEVTQELQPDLEPSAFPLDFLLSPKTGTPFERLIAAFVRLEAEARKDGDIDFAEDCRQTEIALLRWDRGELSSFREASAYVCCQMFGVQQSTLLSRIIANRKARLGKEYSDWYDENDILRPEALKKRAMAAAATGTGDATGDGTSSELPGSTSPASLPMKGRTA